MFLTILLWEIKKNDKTKISPLENGYLYQEKISIQMQMAKNFYYSAVW